ncbi:CrcB-like protein-domain-containing protein [Tribonema minus]|uniref:CrcB-like protein-domain-containing protein n=1 Tax=Tribonema minus TaxID=303371 RepID=A0A835ZHA0_9STRA|nr:CrcB-like protein-domain-containing protein [Tribonema minus]
MLVPAFFDNCMGSMILGLLVAATSTIPKEGGALVLLTGLTTGFCGAYTTFSAWALQTDDLVVANPDEVAEGDPQPQVTGIIYICGGLACFIVVHRMGMDLGGVLTGLVERGAPHVKQVSAAAAHRARVKQGSAAAVHGGTAARCAGWAGGEARSLAACSRVWRALAITNAALLAAAVAALALALGLDDASWMRRRWWLSALFAVPGALLRFALARWLNAFRGGLFPLGTFAANMLGTICSALIAHAYSDYGTDWRDTACRAFAVGFCASLTTMSTLVNELAAIRADFGARHGLVYIGSSVILAEVLAGVIDGRWGSGGGL